MKKGNGRKIMQSNTKEKRNTTYTGNESKQCEI